MSARTALLLCFAAISASLPAQSPDRVPITADQVARALSDSGMATRAEDVSLPSQVVSAVPAPVLAVMSMERLPADHAPIRTRVRLACALAAQCLPFYAFVRWPQATHLAAPGNETVMVKNNVTMRAGSQAILILDDHRSRIQVAVVSLENGMAGQRIRVASPDRKRFYFGEVVSANLLRGSF